jgi:hypothetical protein
MMFSKFQPTQWSCSSIHARFEIMSWVWFANLQETEVTEVSLPMSEKAPNLSARLHQNLARFLVELEVSARPGLGSVAREPSRNNH